MRHEVARTVVCYGHIVNKPAVPSAESIGNGATGNGRVGSCRDNVPHHPGAETWVVGEEPAVVVDFQGMIDYAKSL